jgi:soluble lytic murein transglycosylase-like protein
MAAVSTSRKAPGAADYRQPLLGQAQQGSYGAWVAKAMDDGRNMMQSHPEAGATVSVSPSRWWPVTAWKVAAGQLTAFALVIAAAAAAWTLLPPDTRLSYEERVLGWLQTRQDARTDDAPPPAPRAFTLADLAAPVTPAPAVAAASPASAAPTPSITTLPILNTQQAAVARWISLRYRVASEPIARIVHEAWETGRRAGVDPLLILSVMAIESRFNPFAQSPMGAEGLMQVVTRVHSDKFERFGGDHAAFDPISNLRVGVQVLKESIARAGGSLEEGLKAYVGATSISAEGYMQKVMSEREFLKQVKQGQRVPANANAVAKTAKPVNEPARDDPPGSAKGNDSERAPITVVAADSRPAEAPPTR